MTAIEPINEPRAAGALATEVFAGTVGIVEDTHRAVAGRLFAIAGSRRGPARLLHDTIAATSYGSVRLGGLLAGSGIRFAATVAGAGRELAPITRSTAGTFAVGALNGWAGDRLERGGNDLTVRMSLRHDGGRVVDPTIEGLRAAYPGATSRIALFLHGLTETEHTWWLGTRRKDGSHRPNFGDRLAADHGYTPLYVRYNTGLRVSENGRRLAALLDEVEANWPADGGVVEIAVFGFSMGGLVARSANHYGSESGSRWVGRVRHMFHLGAPHHGTPLERFANWGDAALDRLPETRPIRRLVNGRSGGIKDMRYGNLLETDWRGHDADELLTDRRTPIPYMPTATHYFLGATLGRDPDGPLSRMLGDILVLLPSAWAEDTHGAHRRFDIERSRSYGGMTHFHLVSHPAVYEQISAWISRPALPAGDGPAAF